MTNTPLKEGLIKVHPDMIESAMGFITRQVLWWARDRMKGKTKEFPALARELRILSALHYPDMPKTPYESIDEKPLRVVSRPVPTSGFGKSYDHLKPSDEKYFVAVNWGASRSHGSWLPNKKAVVVSPLSYRWIERYPERNAEETLTLFLIEIKSVLEHELRHAVQTLFLEPVDPNQTRMHQGYAKKNINDPSTMVDYYLSPVEFDPMIGSAVQSFIDEVNLNKTFGKQINIQRALRSFVGMTPSKSFNTSFRTDPFFMILRKKAPKRYIVAVKKFFKEVSNELSKPIEESALMERAAIPNTRYGFWITSDGQFIPIDGPSGHERAAKQYFGTEANINTALAEGWIRVVSKLSRGNDHFLSINVDRGKVSIRAALALKALVGSETFSQFTLDVGPDGPDADWKQFSEPKVFLRYFNEARARTSLTELYREQPGSRFTHDGQTYDLNKLLGLLDDSEAYEVPLDALDWVLEWDDADPERLERADVSAPIIVTWWHDKEEDIHRLVVIDGLHRVKKALDTGMEYIPGHYVDGDDLSTCLVD